MAAVHGRTPATKGRPYMPGLSGKNESLYSNENRTAGIIQEKKNTSIERVEKSSLKAKETEARKGRRKRGDVGRMPHIPDGMNVCKQERPRGIAAPLGRA